MRRTFEEVDGYDEMVVLRDIAFESYCEHHMARSSAALMVRLSAFEQGGGHQQAGARRRWLRPTLPGAGKLTAQIAACIDEVLKPRGVGVVIDSEHQCMTTRGVHKRGVSMVTSRMVGIFRSEHAPARSFCSSSTSAARGLSSDFQVFALLRRQRIDAIAQTAGRRSVGNTWPRCASQTLQTTSMRTRPALLSS